ncbi:DUF2867 domain-containing protein [Thalassobius sp. Cn5-15]|uniref:DUF2867 domain-containing protein n=1 Tax=Thalassobius sp. Cn5-15 TaxID=2917763 RepID=UPI001EF33CCE|nr:DUF2867 domain-containing protein [Thalassobius sp. Cn5-15]MCG7491961.1 DUF2867 domain-containing protein [Thalassobius sp. Cn5-15]
MPAPMSNMLFVQTKLPAQSALWQHHRDGDFIDCYSCPSDMAPQDAASQALTMPSWAKVLLNLRNILVKPLGLKTETSAEGDNLFPVTHDSADEVILGTDDKHLDFRIAILRDQGRIYMSTWVHPHNRMGQIYLQLVMPFHVLIMRNSIRRLAQATA